MRVRHRIPSLFTLSMVDVLCCALGCVILLWLLNLREAKEHEDTTSALLASTRADYERTSDLLEAARRDREGASVQLFEMEGRLLELEDDRDAVRKRLAIEEARAADLDRKLRASAGRVADLGRRLESTESGLRGARADADSLRKDLKDARAKYATEEATARSLEKDIARRMEELKEANRALEGLRLAKRSLERDLEGRTRELARVRSDRDKTAAAGAERVRSLEEELARANRNVAALQDDKKELRAEVGRVRAAAENRFAGITLTGRRVVFLVDTSGSMELREPGKPAPNKWKDVRETVARVMRSLPDLEKFQVITFAEDATFLLGGRDKWLDYDAKTSADRVLRALSAIKPRGGTDMYSALDAAFRLRPQGLDTVYLFSDGLPNLGEGLTPGAARDLTDSQRNDLLGKHIRRTLRTDWNRPLRSQPKVRINAVGFFFESPEVGAFLWALARDNDGSFVGMSKP